MPQVKLMMDSGAYSAFMQGLSIDRDAYAKFCIENAASIHLPINLDYIDPKDPNSAEKSWENYNYLLDKGVKTLPVFHEREPIKWLDKMLEVTDYVGISSGNSTGEGAYKSHAEWYHHVWQHTTDTHGWPIAKFHGFGDTAPTSLNTFPWHTVDSSTWYISGARAGTVILDGRRYQARSKVIRSPHFLDLGSPDAQIEGFLAKFSSWGLNGEMFMKEELSGDELNILRCYCTAAYIKDLLAQSAGCTTYKAPVSLITPRSSKPGIERVGPAEAFFVISGSTAKRAMPILTKLGINNALLSFHYCTPRVWNEDIIPWISNPVEACQTNPKMRPYWDLLERFAVKEVVCL